MKLRFFLPFLALGIAVAMPARSAPAPNSYDDDDRKDIQFGAAPWSWVGKVLNDDGGWCTGTLVGRNLVLTAAHCFLEEDQKTVSLNGQTFRLEASGGRTVAKSRVVSVRIGTLDAEKDDGNDWAIARIADPLGDTYRWAKVEKIDLKARLFAQDPKALKFAGYSDDYKDGGIAGMDNACSVRKIFDDGTFYHDCNMSSGSSGGAIFTSDPSHSALVIAGINIAELPDCAGNGYSHQKYAAGVNDNEGVSAAQFYSALQEMAHPKKKDDGGSCK